RTAAGGGRALTHGPATLVTSPHFNWKPDAPIPIPIFLARGSRLAAHHRACPRQRGMDVEARRGTSRGSTVRNHRTADEPRSGAADLGLGARDRLLERAGPDRRRPARSATAHRHGATLVAADARARRFTGRRSRSLLSPGRMRLPRDVLGRRAVRFTATRRPRVILKGGVGADTIT